MTNAELLALLREARESLDGVVDTDWIPAEMAYVESRAVECIKRIDAALAEAEKLVDAEEIGWCTFGNRVQTSAYGAFILMHNAYGTWHWQVSFADEATTLDEAKDAAIRTARGMR